MVVVVIGFKGGVGKTTTAVHLAGALARRAPTVLVDGDANRSATGWAARGPGLPFTVIDVAQLAAADVQRARGAAAPSHLVIDTAARPSESDLRDLAGADRWVLPSTPDVLALEVVLKTLAAVRPLAPRQLRVLLTVVPPPPSRDAAEARELLAGLDVPLCKAEIRRTAALPRAALAGVLVGDLSDPRAQRAWAAYLAVAKELR